jgi:hypothetical protein
MEGLMVVLAVVLLLLASLVTVGVIAGASSDAVFRVFDVSVQANSALVYLAGLVMGMAILVGITMLSAGMKRGYRRRLELRDLRARHTDSVQNLEKEKQSLAQEKEELAKRLEREKGDNGPKDGRPGPTKRLGSKLRPTARA